MLLVHKVGIELDGISRLFFLFIHNLGVNLRGGHFFVAEHLAYGIDVGAVGELQRDIGDGSFMGSTFVFKSRLLIFYVYFMMQKYDNYHEKPPNTERFVETKIPHNSLSYTG